MGSYTTKYGLYKPVADEFVDVNTQLNPNWDIADKYCKNLFEYQYFTAPNVSDVVGNTAKGGERWYKTYSNCILAADNAADQPGSFLQDQFAHVDAWVNAQSLIDPAASGWATYPNSELSYRIISSPGNNTTEIEWVGRLWMGGGLIATNTTINVLTGVPAGVAPATVHKYFNVWAGNTSSDYLMARVLFLTTGKCEVMIYGSGVATSSAENYVDFGGIRYCVEEPV